jgi:3-hydroxybutyryl-CoA dehydratase
MNAYTWADLSLGMTAEFQTAISAHMLDTFREISGDLNPLHSDAAFARSKGFDGIVVHGMLLSALYSRLVGMYLPGRDCLLHEIRVSFANPVYVDEPLSVAGEVVHLNHAYQQIEIKAGIRRASALVSKATIRVGLRG